MTPRSRATVTGRIKEPQTLSSLVSRWGHRLLVAHQRNSVFSELRQSLNSEKNASLGIAKFPDTIRHRKKWNHLAKPSSSHTPDGRHQKKKKMTSKQPCYAHKFDFI